MHCDLKRSLLYSTSLKDQSSRGSLWINNIQIARVAKVYAKTRGNSRLVNERILHSFPKRVSLSHHLWSLYVSKNWWLKSNNCENFFFLLIKTQNQTRQYYSKFNLSITLSRNHLISMGFSKFHWSIIALANIQTLWLFCAHVKGLYIHIVWTNAMLVAMGFFQKYKLGHM